MTNSHDGVPPGGVRGRPFADGNPGRPRGAKNKSTTIVRAMLAGEIEQIVRTAIEQAKDGNADMIKLCLKSFMPKSQPIEIDLPELKTACDAAAALSKVTSAFAAGVIGPTEAAAACALINSFVNAKGVAEYGARIEAVEKKLGSVLGGPDDPRKPKTPQTP